MKRLVMALALLSGCGARIIGVYAPDFSEGVEAATNAGLPVKASRNPRAVLVLKSTDDLPGLVAGHTYDTRGCRRGAIVLHGATSSVVAHELGHLLGLAHRNEDGNIMQTPTRPENLHTTHGQREDTDREARRLEHCRVER